MVCGYLPFEDPDTNIVYKKILSGKFEIANWVSKPCQDLIKRILNIEPENRFTAIEIMNHEWYRETN
jgi:5'-AMP-activated protein kinase catalytic alpha subunit